jgi:hypothetical protein
MSTHGWDDDEPTDPSWFAPEAKAARGDTLSGADVNYLAEKARMAEWADPLKRYRISRHARPNSRRAGTTRRWPWRRRPRSWRRRTQTSLRAMPTSPRPRRRSSLSWKNEARQKNCEKDGKGTQKMTTIETGQPFEVTIYWNGGAIADVRAVRGHGDRPAHRRVQAAAWQPPSRQRLGRGGRRRVVRAHR